MVALLQLKKIRKEYSGVAVVRDINLELESGEAHVLFGENGAGKSVLISMIAGASRPSRGEIYFKGKRVNIWSVQDARRLGISAVFQEFSLIPQMTVEENLFLGAEITAAGLLRKSLLHAMAAELLASLDFDISPSRRVDTLTRAEQQMVEIAKAFRSDLSILILDEPTASLTQHETQRLLLLIEKLKKQGVGIIYITHRLAEIRQIGTRITVLRDGHYIDTVPAKTTDEKQLIKLMTGRSVEKIFPALPREIFETLLAVNSLTTKDGSVKEASLHVRRGEIVGLAGLIGSGKSEFAQACFGMRAWLKGSLVFKEKKIKFNSAGYVRIASMLRAGFLYLPSDRREEGLMMMRSVRENMSLAALKKKPFSNGVLLNKRAEVKKTKELAKKIRLSPPNIESAVELFSGGNQQKVMLARCLSQKYDLIVFDEPTVGVDVGTRIVIYEFICELCKQGSAIILISSDLPEILNLCHRAYVFYRGRIQSEHSGVAINETNILSSFFGKGALA